MYKKLQKKRQYKKGVHGMNKDILEIAKKIENVGGKLYLVGRSR